MGHLLCAVVALAANGAAVKPPRVEVLRFVDSRERTLALDAPGVVYLVDFWALGCKPCEAEAPELARLAAEYEPSGRFRLVSVAWGGWSAKELDDVARRGGMVVPIYSDPERWFQRLGIASFPTKLLIRDGSVLRRKVGGGPGAYREWKTIIDEMLRTAP